MKELLREKLKQLGLQEEDLNQIDNEFSEAVESRVKAEVDVLIESAEEFIAEKVKESETAKIAELEAENAKAIQEKLDELAKHTEEALKLEGEKLVKASAEYVKENLEQGFKIKYGEELQKLEERLVNSLDQYLEYCISENISEDLINKVAINETFAPIISGIQKLFEQEYVPLDLSGSGKLKEYQSQINQMEPIIDNMVKENLELAELAEKCAKSSIIAEKTADLAPRDRKRIRKFFKDKSLTETSRDIESYCELIKESNQKVEEAKSIDMKCSRPNNLAEGEIDYKAAFRESRKKLSERFRRNRAAKESTPVKDVDVTYDVLSEKIDNLKRKFRKEATSRTYLDKVSEICENI